MDRSVFGRSSRGLGGFGRSGGSARAWGGVTRADLHGGAHFYASWARPHATAYFHSARLHWDSHVFPGTYGYGNLITSAWNLAQRDADAQRVSVAKRVTQCIAECLAVAVTFGVAFRFSHPDGYADLDPTWATRRTASCTTGRASAGHRACRVSHAHRAGQ